MIVTAEKGPIFGAWSNEKKPNKGTLRIVADYFPHEDEDLEGLRYQQKCKQLFRIFENDILPARRVVVRVLKGLTVDPKNTPEGIETENEQSPQVLRVRVNYFPEVTQEMLHKAAAPKMMSRTGFNKELLEQEVQRRQIVDVLNLGIFAVGYAFGQSVRPQVEKID